jgi:hypothetical protein
MPLPDPGLPSTGGLPTTSAAFAQFLNQKFNGGKPILLAGVPSGSNLGDQWMAWYASRPGVSLKDAEDAFIVLWEDATLGTDLQTGLTGGANAIGTSVNAIPAGLAGFNIFHGLDLSQVLLQVGEVLLGIVLIAVGVAKLTGTSNVVASAVKARI